MQHSPKVVAVTGGIGSGKSVVTTLLEKLGAQTVDADVLAREVVAPGSEGLRRVVKHFSAEMVLADGSLNRPKLASIIFADPEKKKLLETLLHPLIRQRWLARLEELKKGNVRLIAYIVPLFFESTSEMPEIESVILVTAPEELRIERIMARDQFPRSIAEQRIKAQLPDSVKTQKSDFIITNDSTLENVERQVKEIFTKLTH